MNRVKKLAVILFICLLNILLISLKQSYPISVSLNTAVFFQIPISFWLVLIISPLSLYIIARYSKNNFVPIICAMLYYVLLYSYGFYFVSHPTFSDIGSSAVFQEILANTSHIGAAEINIEAYFQWPIYFIFSKIFSSILGIAPILTLNLGFVSFISIFPVLLFLFFKAKTNIVNKYEYFIILALYIVLSYFFINDQFVPQFLALIYLVILFGCYIRYIKTKNSLDLLLITIFYTLLVFTHTFMFLFFVLTVIFEKIWFEYVETKKSFGPSYEFLLLTILLPFTYFAIYLDLFTHSRFGESWRILESITSQRTLGVSLYHLVPEIFDQLFANITKVIVIGAFIIVSLGLLLHFLKKREITDIALIFSSFLWFVMGLFKMVLGQRAIQVIPLALSNFYNSSHRIFPYLSKVIIIFILISPSLFVANTIINDSIEGERLEQDTQENIAGKFFDNHLYNKTYYVIGSQSAYPTCLNFRTASIPKSTNRDDVNAVRQYLDYIIFSPKLKLLYMYQNIPIPKKPQDFIIYTTKNVEIIML